MSHNPKLDTAEFVRRAKEKHGDKCDYRDVVYVDSKTPVTITCLQCGATYAQPPSKHLRSDGRGWGCKRCGQNSAVASSAQKRKGKPSAQRKTVEQFIADGRTLHGDKVDYSAVEYRTAWVPVSLTCCICGTKYHQTPHSHLAKRASNGWGCPCCNLAARLAACSKANKGRHSRNKKTTETFIEESKARHGENSFDYSRCRYHGSHSPIELRCNSCLRWFQQIPTNHLRKGGCIYCSYDDRGRRHRLSFEEFVNKAEMVHGKRKHQYFRDEYTTGKQRTRILCLEHDCEFWQSPDAHMAGKTGCTYCRRISKAERCIFEWLEKHNLKFEYQKKFSSCRDRAVLPFDFYLPGEQLLIEYDGEHHYFEYFTSVVEVQRRDAIKTKWAEKNNYRLLRIPYWESVNIPSILKKACFMT